MPSNAFQMWRRFSRRIARRRRACQSTFARIEDHDVERAGQIANDLPSDLPAKRRILKLMS